MENIADTLSINHNWLNGHNITFSWNKLRMELENYARKKNEEIRGEGVEGTTLAKEIASIENNDFEDSDEASTIFGDYFLLRKIIRARLENNNSNNSNSYPTTAVERSVLEQILYEMRQAVE